MAKLAFLFDEHLPNAIARELRRVGIGCRTAHEAGLRGAPDEVYLVYGLAGGFVVVTTDHNFLQFNSEGRAHAGIVYFEQGRRSIGEVIEGLTLIYDVYEQAEMLGRVEYL